MTVLVYHRPEDVKRLCLCCRHSDVTEITKSLTHISHDTTEQLVALRKLKKWFLLFSQFCNVNNIEYYQAASETLKSWDQCRFLGCRKTLRAREVLECVCCLLLVCLLLEVSWADESGSRVLERSLFHTWVLQLPAVPAEIIGKVVWLLFRTKSIRVSYKKKRVRSSRWICFFKMSCL